MTKKLYFLLLLLGALILVACSQPATPAEEEGASVDDVSDASTSDEVVTNEAVDEVDANEPPVELIMAFLTFTDQPEGFDMVQEELNRLTLEKINATVTLLPLSISVYMEQTNLMLTSGEPLDLMFTGVRQNFSTRATNGQLTPLDDLIQQHGQGIVDAVGTEYLEAGVVNGELYAIPTIRDFAANMVLAMRQDVIDQYGIDTSGVDSFDELDTIFAALQEANSEIVPVVPNTIGQSFLDTYAPFDPLGDRLGVLMNLGAELEVVNLYETPEYEAWVNTIHDWYTSGYVLRDVATSTELKNNLVTAGRVFSWVARGKPGYEVQESALGFPITALEIDPPFANTDTVANVMWSIPINSEHPEKAMQFLNLMYTDPEIINLLDWGVEGEHYAKVSDNVIGPVEGAEVIEGWYNLGWQFGNQFLSYVPEEANPDLWTEMAEFNGSAIKSAALGFVFDPSPVQTEIAAVTNVINQYRLGLETGTTDPATELPQFIEALKSAGIDTIVAEKQSQLDAWAEQK